MCIKRQRTYLIESVIQGATGGNTNGQFNFSPQYQLQNLQHLSIELYTAGDVGNSPQGNTVATAAQLKGCYLTLYINDPNNLNSEGQFIQQLPILDLHYIQNAANDPFSRTRFEFAPGITVIWEKSYIQFNPAFGNTAGDNISVLLNVDYANVAVNPAKATP